MNLIEICRKEKCSLGELRNRLQRELQLYSHPGDGLQKIYYPRLQREITPEARAVIGNLFWGGKCWPHSEKRDA